MDIAEAAVTYRTSRLQCVAETRERSMDQRIIAHCNGVSISQKGAVSLPMGSGCCFTVYRIGCGDRVWALPCPKREDTQSHMLDLSSFEEQPVAPGLESEIITLSAGGQV